jgi:glycosyltransferase involved in cell wall biosynthesis
VIPILPVRDEKPEFALDILMPVLQRYPSVRATIVGDGPGLTRLMKRVEREGVRQQVTFRPFAEFMPMLLSADLFFAPATHPIYETVIIDAAAEGVPVLTAQTITALIDRESALLCKPYEVPCFYGGVNELLNSNELRVRLKEGALRSVAAAYGDSIEKHANSLYQALVDSVLHWAPK